MVIIKNMLKEKSDLKKQVLEILAQYLGIDPEDINDDDSLSTDLHMRASDLTDFIQSLNQIGIDTSRVDLTEIDTVEELIEALDAEII